MSNSLLGMNWGPDQIADLRRRLGWSRAEMARRLGFSLPEMEKLETQENNLASDTLDQLHWLDLQLDQEVQKVRNRTRAEKELSEKSLSQIHFEDIDEE